MYPRVLSCIVIVSGLVLIILFVSWDASILLSNPFAFVIPSRFFGELKTFPSDLRFREQATDSTAASETVLGKSSKTSDCDLYHGHWYFDDSTGPSYTNSTCPILIWARDCQGNGRPDKEYESWRWKPASCELPRFNATKFLELMTGKTLAFVGDSLARNQMESLVCSLWQVEVPEKLPKNRMQRHPLYFRSKAVTIIRVGSSWLVHKTKEPFRYVPKGVPKLHLDIPDESFMQHISSFDVVVLNSGHWFATPSVYIQENQIVGTHLWSLPIPAEHQQMNVTNSEAFRISTETALTAMVTHANYSGLTIVVSYSPDHYENGTWNTGGTCTGKLRPLLRSQLVENNFTNMMHDKQVTGFCQATKKQTNKSKLKLMDITEAFSYRHDGHPGPYQRTDPNKITEYSPNAMPPPQDCLHWCMPGAIDTWNEIMLELIRREFEGQ